MKLQDQIKELNPNFTHVILVDDANMTEDPFQIYFKTNLEFKLIPAIHSCKFIFIFGGDYKTIETIYNEYLKFNTDVILIFISLS